MSAISACINRTPSAKTPIDGGCLLLQPDCSDFNFQFFYQGRILVKACGVQIDFGQFRPFLGGSGLQPLKSFFGLAGSFTVIEENDRLEHQKFCVEERDTVKVIWYIIAIKTDLFLEKVPGATLLPHITSRNNFCVLYSPYSQNKRYLPENVPKAEACSDMRKSCPGPVWFDTLD